MNDLRIDESLRDCDLSTIPAPEEPTTTDSKKSATPRWLHRTIILVGFIVVALIVSVILLATTVEKVFSNGGSRSSALDVTEPSPSASPSSSSLFDPTQIPTTSPPSLPESLPSAAPERLPPLSSTESPSQLQVLGEPSVVEESESSNPSSRPTTVKPSTSDSNSPSFRPPPNFVASASPISMHPSSFPSVHPSIQPSMRPSLMPSKSPSKQPTRNPITSPPSNAPTEVEALTTFYAIGDVPYNTVQRTQLIQQIATIPADADFVIHVGDIRSARDGSACTLAEYQDIANILKESPVPVFIVLGDNEHNDCPNPQQGWSYWHQELQGLESYWGDDFEWVLTDIQRFASRPETFYFVRKGALFIGLNIVGGRILNQSEWTRRLAEQATWTINLMRNHGLPTVIFAHANPLDKHNDYFTPLTAFIQNEWDLPLVYLNGDKHQWMFNSSFYGQNNWYRVMLQGGTTDPPLKCHVNTSSSMQTIAQTFSYDRQLL